MCHSQLGSAPSTTGLVHDNQQDHHDGGDDAQCNHQHDPSGLDALDGLLSPFAAATTRTASVIIVQCWLDLFVPQVIYLTFTDARH
ncbi:hypothetical protein [Mycobacterium lepromatosis]|uniref:hypothetical protein n=1 Tax=Mycobacterium lepromatosis TaxID=480418 RepID=UPI001EDA8320|nr:hypothetical protein [Mycobacterium lepromatosis]